MIELVDFRAQWAHAQKPYLEAIDRVGRSGWLILGTEVSAFEAELAKFWGIGHAVGCASGLDALEIAFRASGMVPGDKVLTTPLSAFATTLALLRVGAVPIFADVDASGLLDLADAQRVLAEVSEPVRYLVPVHLYGHAMDLQALQAFAECYGLVVIEDCAQAIGATSRNAPVGSLGPACATSFYPTKNLGAFGDGGALLTDSLSIRDLARRLRDYGQSEKYVHSELGLNSRLDELQAALLRSVQLPELAAQTQRRVEIAKRYTVGLRNPRLEVVPTPPGSCSVWHLFPVLVGGDRTAFQTHLSDAGVGSAVHYPRLIPRQPVMRNHGIAANRDRDFPLAQVFADHEVSLPIHPFLSDADVDAVIQACNRWEGA